MLSRGALWELQGPQMVWWGWTMLQKECAEMYCCAQHPSWIAWRSKVKQSSSSTWSPKSSKLPNILKANKKMATCRRSDRLGKHWPDPWSTHATAWWNDSDFGSSTNIQMRLHESQRNDRQMDTNRVSFVYSSAIVLGTPLLAPEVMIVVGPD